MKTKKHRHKKKKQTQKYKKEACSPKKNGTALPFTCYTTNALNTIKQIWNMRHPDQLISSEKPKEIWESLKTLTRDTCNSESCWLRHQCIKNNLDKNMFFNNFAPYSPKNWKYNPTEWLSTVDIQKVMAQWENAYKEFEFIGPSPIDYDTHMVFGECVWEELCKFSLNKYKRNNTQKIGVIFNLDKHTQPGSHWVALYIDLVKHKLYYFDSYGDNIPNQIKKFCNNIVEQGRQIGENYEIIVSKKRHQYGDSECGMYSLFFIIQMLKGVSHSVFEKKRISDDKMVRLRKKFFNVK